MASPATFESFQQELARLVENFDRHYPVYKSPEYNEATLRSEFLDPFFRALGWDVGNTKNLIHTEREVDIEVRTAMSGRQTRADYIFRYARFERFTCEAKRPSESLNERHIYQAKRDAFTRSIPLALLSDFEDLKIFVVGARPHRGEPHTGEWKVLNFRQFVLAARELWDLLAYESVVSGSIDRLIDSLPKRPLKLKDRQGWLIKPDRTRSLDSDFLNFLDDARQQLGSDLLKHNADASLREGHRLNEAAQRIIDRLVFLRICEDRGIDTGELLESIFRHWFAQQAEPPRLRRPGRQSHLRFGGGTDGSDAVAEEPPALPPRPRDDGGLYRELVEHMRALDHRPPTHKPFLNGQLFSEHFSEKLAVGDEWLSNFILDLTDDDTGYNFADIRVEILGDAYERFLGKVLRPHGRGALIEEKPEVRKAGGVYYTPRYITDYIVEQTIGRLLEGKSPRDVEKLRFVDPACGSGSFLIRAYERVMEHHLRWFIAKAEDLRKEPGKETLPLHKLLQRYKADCYVDAANNVRLTTALKRRILLNNIYGVDIDAQAVEVTQLSLYLKMLEGENRDTLRQQTELFRGEPLLPPLDRNIRCFNSLIASDFSLDPAELVRVNAGDWEIQFPDIMKAGGFDAVVGNPPYILLQSDFRDDSQLDYFRERYGAASFKLDTYHLFIERGVGICRIGGRMAMITPANYLANNHLKSLREFMLRSSVIDEILVVDGGVFAGVSVDTAITVLTRNPKGSGLFPLRHARATKSKLVDSTTTRLNAASILSDKHVLFTASSSDELPLWTRISAISRPLGDLAKVNFGKQLRDRKKFPTDVIQVASLREIKRTHHPCYTGRDIGRYDCKWSGLACLVSQEAQCGGCWDESKHRAKGKLLTRQIGKWPTFGFDSAGYECLNTIFMVNVDDGDISPQFVLGILNSRLLRYLWLARFYDQRGTFPKIKGTYLKLLPIVRRENVGRVSHLRLVSLVNKLLLLTPALRLATTDAERRAVENAIVKCDRDVDQLVYQLYGLTQEEIALVEAATAGEETAPRDGNVQEPAAPALEAD